MIIISCHHYLQQAALAVSIEQECTATFALALSNPTVWIAVAQLGQPWIAAVRRSLTEPLLEASYAMVLSLQLEQDIAAGTAAGATGALAG